MRHSSALLALAAACASTASPVAKRADFEAPDGGDTTILNYALTLEYLERKFYQEGLANYTAEDFSQAGFGPEFYTNLQTIAADEESHVAFLAGALGSAAVQEATYSFPSTTAESFVGLANVLEGVGVSAYLGAAAAIANKAYLTVAGAILTVEARHSSYIRSSLQQKDGVAAGPSPFPKPYDTPLDFNQVFSLAAQFITGFAPGDPALPFTAFPPLAVEPGAAAASARRARRASYEPPSYDSPTPSPDGGLVAGQSGLRFPGAYKNARDAGLVGSESDAVYAVFFSGLDTYYAPVTVDGDDYVLDTIPGANFASDGQLPPTGQVYVILSTADGDAVKTSDETTISGVGVIEVRA